ncbi:hypothetical protein C8Q76DRAFT_665579 [Earliella scabrosa]|nr:hypothetical protein C8Q76DRAFT_665579 [Earliella scabrosa]
MQPPPSRAPRAQPRILHYQISQLPAPPHAAGLATTPSSSHPPVALLDHDDHGEDPTFADIHPREFARRVAYATDTFYNEERGSDFHQPDEGLDPEAMAEIDDDPEAAEDHDEDGGTHTWHFDEAHHEGPDNIQIHTDPTPDVRHDSRAPSRARSDSDSDDERPPQRRRVHSPSPEPDVTTTAQTAQRQPNAKSSGIRDYEPRAQAILNRAITLYKANLTTKNAYPDKLMEKIWAKKAWAQAAQDLRIDLAPDDRVIELITRYTWNLRSEYKTAARAFVQASYGFKSAPHAASAEANFNETRADFLLKNRRFTYKDPEQLDGLYEAPIIQMVVNKIYYKKPADDGIIHQDLYRHFPLAGIALALTAIQCAICEWKTGVFNSVRFDEGAYGTVYAEHVAKLEELEAKSEQDKIVTDIGRQIARTGRAHAKAPPVQHHDKDAISSSDIDRAITAYRLRKQQAISGGM